MAEKISVFMSNVWSPGFSRFAVRTCFCLLFSRLLVPGAEQDRPNSVALEALNRLKGIDLESNPAVKTAVLKILEQVKGTPQFVEIVRDFKIKGQESALLDFACKGCPNRFTQRWDEPDLRGSRWNQWRTSRRSSRQHG
jgi:hypothetical protein